MLWLGWFYLDWVVRQNKDCHSARPTRERGEKVKLCREGLHRGLGGRQGGADLGLVEHLEVEVAAEQEEAKRDLQPKVWKLHSSFQHIWKRISIGFHKKNKFCVKTGFKSEDWTICNLQCGFLSGRLTKKARCRLLFNEQVFVKSSVRTLSSASKILN